MVTDGQWPSWWGWDLELTPHVLRRMVDRCFTEIDLRAMLEEAEGYRPDVFEDRWVIEVTRPRRRWEVIVEPDTESELLVVITAYPVDED